MKTKNKSAIMLLILIFIVLTLTGCAEGKSEIVGWKYDKKSKNICLETDVKDTVYATFDVVLLNKSEEIIFLKEYNKKYISNTNPLTLALQDVKPEYIKDKKIDSIEVRDITVMQIDNNKYLAIITFCMIMITFLLDFFKYVYSKI